MKPVLQQEKTGCGIAWAATLAGVSYAKAKPEAKKLGITADDQRLWSDTKSMRTLLGHFGIDTENVKQKLTRWDALPDIALLATKWHMVKGIPFWRWTVFIRNQQGMAVLDPKREILNNLRTDFGRIKPKWFIKVKHMNN